MPTGEITYDVHSKTYVAIFHTARHLLITGERYESGSVLNLQAATVFFAFAFEAYLNHVGKEELPFWDEIDRFSHQKKLTVLGKHLGFTKDISQRPFLTMVELFKLRNALAHGRTQNLTITKTTDLPPPDGAVWNLLPWEQLTPTSVRQYHDDVRAAIERINSVRPVPDQFLWNEGMRGFTSKID